MKNGSKNKSVAFRFLFSVFCSPKRVEEFNYEDRSEMLLTPMFSPVDESVVSLCAYTPNNDSEYLDLLEFLGEVLKSAGESVVLLWNFNAHVGKDL